MKTKYLLTIPALMLVLSGCKQEVSSVAPSQDSSIASVASAAESENTAADASTEAVSDSASVSEASSGSGYQNNPKERNEVKIDDDSAALYDSFLEGTAKATYISKNDKCEYLEFSTALEDGKSYTLEEMVSDLTTGVSSDSEVTLKGVSADSIDCGLDGKIEMIVHPDIESEFHPSIVIKNVGGSLKVCYIADSWDRNSVFVGFNGMTSSTGSGGASSHGGEEGYIDASGEYHFWHAYWEELYGERDNNNKLSFEFNGDGNEYTIDGADLMTVVRYDLDENRKEENTYYQIYMMDSDYNDIEDAPNNSSNPFNAARDILVKEKGLNVVSGKEIDDMLAAKRKEIGLSDEVYKFGE